MEIRGIVLDLDGVVIDSELCWQRAREAFAAERGTVWTPSLQHQAMGAGSARWLALMQEHVAPDLSTDAIYADMIARMRAEYERSLPLREGAVEAVTQLARHYDLALASGAPSDLIDHAMARSGLGRHMKTIVYGDTVPNGKPAPDIYLEALARLDLNARETVGIEDSTNGLEALFAAGLWTIATPVAGFQPPQHVLARAHDRLDRLSELTPARASRVAQ